MSPSQVVCHHVPAEIPTSDFTEKLQTTKRELSRLPTSQLSPTSSDCSLPHMPPQEATFSAEPGTHPTL